MNLENISFRTLVAFSELYRTRNVSKAAENLGVSQPSVSVALNRLREHFKDRLFVRTSAGMEPTPHAEQLIGLVDKALDHVHQAMGYQAEFFPPSSLRKFSVCMTDIAQLLVLPRWLEHRQLEAPNIGMEIVRMSEVNFRALETGDIDIALGYFPEMRAGLYEKPLGLMDFSCVSSVNHPRIRDTLSLEQFQTEPTVVIDCIGSGLQYAEVLLQQRKVARRIVFQVPDLLGVESMIAQTDMIATVPTPVAIYMARHGGVKQLRHPVALPEYKSHALWHERFHRDPGHIWMRRIITDIWISIVNAHRV